MGELLTYLIKVAIILLLFYSVNKVLFAKETLYRLNRVMWLTISISSFIIPFINPQILNLQSLFSANNSSISTGEILVSGMEEVGIAQSAIENIDRGYYVVLGIIALWAIGILSLFIFKIVQYSKLMMMIRKGKRNLSESEDKLFRSCLKELDLEEGGVKIILLTDKEASKLGASENSIGPFSWMKYIFISRTDLAENGREILIHELAHIKAGHSYDLIIADIMILLEWFNPAAWLLKSAMAQNHEYLADEQVLKTGVNMQHYQTMLVKKAIGQRAYSMTNSLNHNNLKNRIIMMLKSKSSKRAVLKSLYALPLALFAVSAFAMPSISEKFKTLSEYKVKQNYEMAEVGIITTDNQKFIKVNDEPISIKAVYDIKDKHICNLRIENENKYQTDEEKITLTKLKSLVGKFIDSKDSENIEVGIMVTPASSTMTQNKEESTETVPFMMVEVKPTFQGEGPNKFSQWIGQNLKYPEAAKTAKKEGRVMLQFSVDTDGSITDIKVLRNDSGSKELEEEALRVVGSSPKWEPGKDKGKAVKVQYIFPVIFQLK